MISTAKFYAALVVAAFLALAVTGLGLKVVTLQKQVFTLSVEKGAAKEAQAKAEKDLLTFRGEQATKTADLESTNRRLENQLGANARAAAQEKANALEALRTEHAAAVQRLQHRPTRPAASPVQAGASAPAATPTMPEWCDGSRLWREDGQFLIGEVAIARGLQAELRELRRLYDEAAAVKAVSQETVQ